MQMPLRARTWLHNAERPGQLLIRPLGPGLSVAWEGVVHGDLVPGSMLVDRVVEYEVHNVRTLDDLDGIGHAA